MLGNLFGSMPAWGTRAVTYVRAAGGTPAMFSAGESLCSLRGVHQESDRLMRQCRVFISKNINEIPVAR
jgi:hypothetical protein